MTRASDLGKAISTDLTYAQNDVKAGKDPSAHIAKALRYAEELAGLPADKPTTTTTSNSGTSGTPSTASGLTNYAAAQVDAGFVFQASLGNTVGADTNPAPGAAKALGFNGAVGDSTTSKYGVFKNGELTETLDAPPDAGWDFTFGLAAGFNNDDPYTGPGAARP
jgi:hypothetical protein